MLCLCFNRLVGIHSFLVTKWMAQDALAGLSTLSGSFSLAPVPLFSIDVLSSPFFLFFFPTPVFLFVCLVFETEFLCVALVGTSSVDQAGFSQTHRDLPVSASLKSFYTLTSLSTNATI